MLGYEALSPCETVLVLLKAVGGRVDGLGVLQKLVYICSVAGAHEGDFCATPYGPVSDSLRGSLARLVSTHQVSERFLGRATWGAYAGAYSYELTSSGDSSAERVWQERPGPAERVDAAIQVVRKATAGFAEPVLAGATGLHLATQHDRLYLSGKLAGAIAASPTAGVSEVAGKAGNLAELLWRMQAPRSELWIDAKRQIAA